MTLQKLKESITNTFDAAYSAQIYLVLKSIQGYEVKLADIESDKTAPEIKAMFSGFIHDSIVCNEDLQLCELSVADERSNAIYRYDYEEYPEELGLFKDFDITQAVNAVKYDFTKDDLSSLHGYIVYLGSMTDGILLFKKHYSISLIKRDSFLLGAVKSKHRFEKLDGEDIIRLNGTAQLVRADGEIIVLDIKVLERNFGFTSLIYKSVDETVQAIDDLALLEDVQVLKDAAEDISFARKLSKVKKYSPVINLSIPKETVIEFTRITPALAGKFKYSEDGSKIRLDTKTSKESFIKLLNDAFLHSELTKQYYEAKAKDNISQEG